MSIMSSSSTKSWNWSSNTTWYLKYGGENAMLAWKEKKTFAEGPLVCEPEHDSWLILNF